MFRGSSLLSLPSCSCTLLTRSVHKWTYVYKKTGRGQGIAVTQGKLWRYHRSDGRTFNQLEGKRFGFDTGLEDRLVLQSLSGIRRRLDDKKRSQLASIYQNRMMDVVSANDALAEYRLAFSKVTVDSTFSEVVVYWVARGKLDENAAAITVFEEITECLEQQRFAVRRQLSELLGSNVPEVKFRPDRSELIVAEMNSLFTRADYGMDYRALSDTGRVLGQVKEEAKKERKKRPTPEWKVRLEQKKEEGNEGGWIP